jgi:hypothetical protein
MRDVERLRHMTHAPTCDKYEQYLWDKVFDFPFFPPPCVLVLIV